MPRLTTQADLDLYGAAIIAEGQTPMQVNDVILFLSERNNFGNIFDTTAFPGARLGATYWIEGGPSSYNSIEIGTSSTTAVTLPSDANNPNHIHFFNGQGNVNRVDAFSLDAREFEVNNFDYLIMDFETNSKPGLRDGWGSGRSNSFGFKAIQTYKENNAMAIHINNARGTMKQLEIRGAELTKGSFAKLRAFSGPANFLTKYVIERCCIGQSSRGEGIYSGLTTGGTVEAKAPTTGGTTVDLSTLTIGGSTSIIVDTSLGNLTPGDYVKIYSKANTNKYFFADVLSYSGTTLNLFNIAVINGTGTLTNGSGVPDYDVSVEPNFPLFQNLIVRDNILFCTAAEAIQLQQCGLGTRVHNNVIFLADIDYRSAFQADQDTGNQLDISQGDVWFYNNIICHFGKNGFQIFNKSIQGYPFGSLPVKIFNNYWTGTKAGLTARTHSSTDLIANIIWRDNDIGAVHKIYQDVGTNRNYHYDMDGDSPAIFIGGRIPNDGQPTQNDTTGVTEYGVTRTAVPEVEFVNAGFTNIDLKQITIWSDIYTVGPGAASNSSPASSATVVNLNTLTIGGSQSITINTSTGSFPVGTRVKVFSRANPQKYFYAEVGSYSGTTLNLVNISSIVGSGTLTDPTSGNPDYNVGKRISYTTNDFCWTAERDMSLDYKLYKCITDHTAHEDLRPDLGATISYWEEVLWDSAGKNRYDPAYNPTLPQTTDFMTVAGDFRLVKGSEHHLLGRGLTCNEQREDQTKMGWQWKETETGVIRDIPGAYDIKLELARYSYLKPGRYYRFWVEKMNSSGVLQGRINSHWTLI